MNQVSPMNQEQLKNIVEAAIMAAGTPASIDYLLKLFSEDEQVGRDEIRAVLALLSEECEPRGIELKQVASGYRYQVKQTLSPWLSRLAEERPARYSRALLETLSLIVYRQPVTRAEIEDVRGVAVSSSIIKTLLEREWVRVVGHRDVPGKPALYGTTRQFLDYFNLKSLSELPPLAEIRSLDSIQSELELKVDGVGSEGDAANAESIGDEMVDSEIDTGIDSGATADSTALVDDEQHEAVGTEPQHDEAELSSGGETSFATEAVDDTSVTDTQEEGEVVEGPTLDTQEDGEDSLAAKAG